MDSIENTLTTDDLLTLVTIARELTSKIDLADLLQLILAKSGELTDSPDGAVLLYNMKRKSLYFAGAIGEDTPMLMEQFGEFGQKEIPLTSTAGLVFEDGNSRIIDNAKDDPDHYKGVDKETSRSTKSMLCVPLTADGKRLGVMQILNKRSGAYTQHDRILLEHFADYAAIALRNAHLFEQLIARSGLYTSQRFIGLTELSNQLDSPARSEKLTVLFADMRGFRSLCQKINDPEEILKIISEFVAMLSEQVLRNGGLVNKFLGDGILALFQHPEHAQRAVTSAFAMVDEFEKLRNSWDKTSDQPLTFLDIGIGITTDLVSIGTVGKGKVQDFTAIGTAVNLAAAFEKEARGGKHILVDFNTYSAVNNIVELVSSSTYELRQTDQSFGKTYKQYHIKPLKPIKLIKPLKAHKLSKSPSVFISCSQLDREFVEGNLIPFLNKNNIGSWYFENNIKPGESWVKSITTGLETRNWVLVIVSRHSVNSDWVKEEVNMAAASPRLRNKIIPVQIDDTKPEQVDSFLRHKQSIDARGKNRDTYTSDLIALIQLNLLPVRKKVNSRKK